MFDRGTITDSLYGLVGLEQPFDPTYAILDDDNQTSRSGYKANGGGNPFVKVRYVKETQDYKDISDDDFNALLKRIQESAIVEVCNEVFNTPDIVQRNLIYQYPINLINTTSLSDGFVGHKFEMSRRNNIAFEIKKVVMNFQGTGDITLQLYSSQQQAPLFEQEITITDTTQTQELNWVVNNVNSYKGNYYLGYIVNGDLKPYKRDYENSDIITCFDEFYISQIQVSGHDSDTLFDQQSVDGLSDFCGINADMTVYEDYTDTIINSQSLFAKAIDIKYQIALMRIYMGSIRSNRDQRHAQELYTQMLAIIEGVEGSVGSVGVQGLTASFVSEVLNIQKQVNKQRVGYFGGNLVNTTIY